MKIKSAVPILGAPWRHPWHTAVRWNHELERFEARIRPGLVNAMPASIKLARDDWPRGFTAEADSADVPLTFAPMIPLGSFRSVGTDVITTETPEAVPEFFRHLGVVDGTKVDPLTDAISLPPAQSTSRLLRACDLVLHIDRPATATQWTTGAGVDGVVAQFALTVTVKPDARRTAYVTVAPRWVPPVDRTDLIRGDVADVPSDEYLIATVFFLSPRLAGADDPVDGSWAPFVQHHEPFFWNVRHAMNRPQSLAQQNLTLNTGLAGGAGDAINNFILAQINDPLSAAAQFLANGRLTSTLYTA
jgi:hypothetical protein